MKKPKPVALDVPAITPATTEERAPLTFSVNIITDIDPSKPLASDHGRRFIQAGSPSPYFSVDEVPLAYRPFIGRPPEPQDLSHLQAEWDALDESLGFVSESVAEEISRKQSEAVADAAAIADVLGLRIA